MNCNSSDAFSVPLSFVENPESVRNVVQAANNALKNINTLYNEIMTPKLDPEYGSNICDSEYEPKSYASVSESLKNSNKDKNIVRTTRRSGLCNRCRTYVSYCDSCRNQNRTAKSRISEGTLLNNFEQQEFKNRLRRRCSDTNTRFKVTIPQPFSLTAEDIKRQEAKSLKISQLKEKLQKEEEKELKVRISSKPVPKHVSRPLYEEMVERNEKRKQERKEKCIEILEKESKPFQLTTKSKSISDLTKEPTRYFQARPLPKNILNENIPKKLKDKEEIRKILISHRAEEMLKKSALPFSPKNISRSYSSINLNECPKNKNDKPKPDIDAITKRLYTIKCRETLENWNNKVLDSKKDNSKTFDPNKNTAKPNELIKCQNMPKSSLPFYNFPVRMSTAAALREKRIR